MLWLLPLALIVPNIALDITEGAYSILDRIINILVPGGIWLLLLAASRRPGIASLCLTPAMVLGAFQIVLLMLYGESIIAVDMFLNVMTTNVHEASELLRNLGPAVLFVCVLYLPFIIMGIIATTVKAESPARQRTIALIVGLTATATGGILMLCAVAGKGYAPDRRLFPVNVISNIFTAGERTALAENYAIASEPFRFHAMYTRSDTIPCLYVLVIGETSRADNWQLNGYRRSTNPRLSKCDGLIYYCKTLSESNTTHKSVPLMMSHLASDGFGDSIYCSKGIIDAFKEAGFSTEWYSAQQRNGQLIDFFGESADTSVFITDDRVPHHDMELCDRLRHSIDANTGRNLFVVLHTYGSHFNYSERYPQNYAVFSQNPDMEATPENRKSLLDAYDNTILYTDAVLDSIIYTLENSGRPAAMVYLADHGEDIFDDSRHRFLHASPTPTYWQLHVPMLVWMSDAYRMRYPAKYSAARSTAERNVSSSRSAFHTLISLAGIETPYYKSSAALTENTYSEPTRMYLNDYNEAVPLRESGLREQDFIQLRQHGISF